MKVAQSVDAPILFSFDSGESQRPETFKVGQSIPGFSSLVGRHAPAGLIFALTMLLLLGACRNRSQPQVSTPLTLDADSADQFKQAALKVEEDRGEPTGRQAKVEVPLQLRHYPDSRRFLSLQIAEWRKHQLQTPHDFAELISLIGKGEFVEVPALGKSYILYGVGFRASDGPFTHYDKESGDSVPLFAETELQQEYADLGKSLAQLKQTDTELRKQLAATPRRDRELAKKLRAELTENKRSETDFRQKKALLDRFYQNAKSREVVSKELESIGGFAKESGKEYSLTDPGGRKALRVRLLSYLRPAALRVMEDLAKLYQDRFGRPLAITSLVRPDEYQRQLRETNPNATLIDVPPHSTGLAFDVYYRYMTAAEQHFVMSELARLKDEGKIAALRENANHFHVFVFIDGKPPAESLITSSLKQVGAAPKIEESDSSATRRSQGRKRNSVSRKGATRKP